MTFLLGPNGAGKTSLLHALTRMFGSVPAARRITAADFHIEPGETPTAQERTFWVEAEFTFPELAVNTQNGSQQDQDDVATTIQQTPPESAADHGQSEVQGEGAEINDPAVPPHFAHMRLDRADGVPVVRFRLTAKLHEDGDVSDELVHVLRVDGDDEPVETAIVNRYDRALIQVHYLPARRDPADHVSYAAHTMLGKLLRAAHWNTERQTVEDLGQQISDALASNPAAFDIGAALTGHWQGLHTGSFLQQPNLSFISSDLEDILRHVTLSFTPAHSDAAVDFSLLSDGQQSLLYLSLVLTWHQLGRDAMVGKVASLDVDRLNPPVFTLLAVEEPENSLAPHYLGRVLKSLRVMAAASDGQAVVATHTPALVRRVEPEQIRYLRLDADRRTVVKTIIMPEKSDAAHKFVREALHAYPELYFSRLVVLGEGDSEEVVLPRCFSAAGLGVDETAVSVVPLGGRHVNHFWRLLHGLEIPHVTLLDLDIGRYQGGWGRMKYAAAQLLEHHPAKGSLTQANVDQLAARTEDIRDTREPFIAWFEQRGVFYSAPLDLDFVMMRQFRSAYEVRPEELAPPEDGDIKSVLGKTGQAGSYTEEEKSYFAAYHSRFNVGSKPTHHIAALADMDDVTLLANLPPSLSRLIDAVRRMLLAIPE
ncbi:chromosome segregation protein SMC [Kineosporia sp. NBRC 101731]|nr:chromosome segregation protein SMC [Kineosporia sp. NBRC 101731]